MRNLKSSRAIYAKGLLFLVIGMAAAGLVVLENPTPKTGLLLAIALWAFCRFYASSRRPTFPRRTRAAYGKTPSTT